MGRGVRSGLKRSSSQHVRVKSKDSEDSDEDYVAEVDEVDEQSDELDSLVGDASEEESYFVEDEEEEEEEDDGEEEWRTVVKSTARKRSTRSKKNGIKRAKKRRKVERNADEDCDDDDYEATSDEEFTPDEIDSLGEEEEFTPPKMRAKERGRASLARRSAKKSRGKTSSKIVKKPVKKKCKKARTLRRKAKPCDDEDFIERCHALRERSRKKPVHRKKRATVISDSDPCSESSDYEFTISEEEREQVREANEICRSLATNLRSSRRIQEEEVPCEPRKTPVKKGKEKAEETKNDVGKPVCGICLTEEGKNTIRGTLNCCSHYFCFACILEWSKVESRCPLCKQRFVTISKPTRCVKGFDLRNVVIQVPERDQVYQPSEEELRDFLNPYENVICTECHHGGDDDLMLLCDLCDSPAHTYCVGLGREVPEGNWYCDGCRPTALGSSHSQSLDLTPDQRPSGGASSTYENMAEIDLNVTIPETPVSQGNAFLSPRYLGGGFQASQGNTVVTRRRMQHRIHRFIYNRLNHMPLGADFNNLRSLLGAGFNSTFQHSGIRDVGTSRNAYDVARLHENPPYNVENRNSIPRRPGNQVGQASASGDGLAYSHTQWNGLDGIDLGVSEAQISSDEQLRPCTSRSSFGPDFCLASSPDRDDHANMIKQRVQSIVKRQLKNLSQDIKLDDNIYVDISRRSAETIMVAYGLEPRRLDSYEVRRPSCLHVEGLVSVEMSPVNGCCLTCFENFAKDVVKRMMDIALGPHWLYFRH